MKIQGRSSLDDRCSKRVISAALTSLLASFPLSLTAFPYFLEETYLLDVSQGSIRSRAIYALRSGGYELSGGQPVSFVDWYTPTVPELNLIFMTQANPSFGIIWGVSTGEAGEKYRISPGLHAGFILQRPMGERGTLTLRATTLVGGRLQETPCIADFGEIGGVVPVNCRLAAGTLPPEETLRYLIKQSGREETSISLRYELRF